MKIVNNRRVQDQIHAAHLDPYGHAAFAAACFDAGWVLDCEEWLTEHERPFTPE